MAKVIPKGCTAINTFKYPYTEEETAVIYITYQQGGRTVLEFEKDDITFSAGQVSVYLTQEDTLKLASKVNVSIQIRARLVSGDAVKSKETDATVDTLLKNGVI